MEDSITARQVALQRLTMREHSVSEMISHLVRKGFSEEESREAVAELTADGSISDERYARAITRHHSQRKKGPRYIMAKLAEKGVRVELRALREIFAEVATDTELETARKVAESRYPRAFEEGESASKRKEQQRAFQGLMRRGFSSDIARQCLKKPV